MHPLERLVNLVALLLSARIPVTFQEIREKLPAYSQDDVESAKRMFERDKDALRAAGVPVEVAPVDAWESETGYIIPEDEYYLPEISFTEGEASALVVLAATPAGDDEDAVRALRKLFFGAERSPLAGPGPSVPAVVDEADDPRAAAVANAISRRRCIRFRYKSVTGETSERRLDPYGLVWRSGHAYAVGLDRDRGEIRAFRVSRFASDPAEQSESSAPPEGFVAREHVTPRRAEASAPARIMLSPSVAWWAVEQIRGARVEAEREDGWAEAAVPVPADDWLVSWVLSFGPDANVLEPESLRDAVRSHLEATVARF